ncbi:hypothetical protein CDL15_Pgr005783 [Punica granatum]|uniref:F-box domain-containing protein n=1 Tax=Punica granatum TaxID=22663 RepID=A0A218WFZ2_PUNGR|nr:hypothetical protein CDL15_Pgr005783 [Punica granatum]PKI77782.1 hypothetical protein CRG98_001830 [Punica granatum]
MATTFKLAKCSEIMDRLSLLPDEILSENILSHLPTKEAVRTSTLAHRWRFLWSCIPGLDLDFNSSEKVAACSHHSRKEIFRKGGKAASDYVKWVDQVVRTCSRSSTALRHFCICFRLDKSFSHEIDSWRIFSLGKGVEVLELDFCVEEYMDDGPRYALPSIQPHLFPKLRLLKSLYLGGLSINNDSLERLLLECQFLERLQLRSVTSLTEVHNWLPHLPDLSGLKHLKLTLDGLDWTNEQIRRAQNLHGMASLIKAAPRVQRLTLMLVLQLHPELNIREEEFANLNLQFLRVIEIVGFNGREVESELAVQSSKGAPSLEKLIIDLRYPPLRGRISGEYGCCSGSKIEEWRRSALEIKQRLPSKVELVII